jgi:phytoene synthase
MRRCDDISDDPSLPPEERRQKLDTWLDGLHAAQAGYPTDDPILLALIDAQRRFNIPAGLLDQLAYGTRVDVEENLEHHTRSPVRYRNFQELERYCYGVASVVGLVCIRIFGYHDPVAEALAEKCGLAFQLTNIIRDIKEDAALGRIYLPEDDLAQFGVAPSDLATAADPKRIRPLLAFEAQRARENYTAGDELLSYINEDSQPALWVLVNIYRNLLEKIASLDYDVFSRRVSLSTREKLIILGKGFLKRIL